METITIADRTYQIDTEAGVVNGMRITEMSHGTGYIVHSTSGHTYEVTEQSARYNYEYDGEYMAVWGCSCPAGEYRRACKHVAAVIILRQARDEVLMHE